LSKYTKIFAYINGLNASAATAFAQSLPAAQHAPPGPTPKQTEEITALQVNANLNSAIAFTTLQEYSKAVQACNRALELSPDNVKARFRRGHALLSLGDLDGAEKDLMFAQSKTPDDAGVNQVVAQLKKRLASHAKKEAKAFAGMFDKLKMMDGD